jgi:hypothetical protein
MKAPIYSGIFLTDESKAALLALFGLHDNLFVHHITLAFRPDAPHPREGEAVNFRLLKHFADAKGEAVTVAIPDDLTYVGKSAPHITISCAEGVKPFYSNTLISNGEGVAIPEGLTLTGIIDGFYGG